MTRTEETRTDPRYVPLPVVGFIPCDAGKGVGHQSPGVRRKSQVPESRRVSSQGTQGVTLLYYWNQEKTREYQTPFLPP